MYILATIYSEDENAHGMMEENKKRCGSIEGALGASGLTVFVRADGIESEGLGRAS